MVGKLEIVPCSITDAKVFVSTIRSQAPACGQPVGGSSVR